MQSALLNHYLYGAFYPRGGASEIAFHIIPVIQRAGGKVLVRAPVTNILVNDDGKAIGECIAITLFRHSCKRFKLCLAQNFKKV